MHSLQKCGEYFRSVALLIKESMNSVSIATILLVFRRLIRRFRFPIDQQLQLISTFETYRAGQQTANALTATRDLYVEMLGIDSIPVQVINSMDYAGYQGKSYVDGMREWFDDSLVTLYQVSLEAGSSGADVRGMASELLEQNLIRKQIFSELKMPIMINIISIVFLIVLNEMFLPIVSELAKGLDGVGIAWVQRLSEIFINQGVWFFLSFFLFYMFFKWLQPRWYGEQRTKVDHIFPFSLYREFESAKLIKLLAFMRKSKLNLKKSLERIAPLLSPYLRWHVEEMVRGLYAGIDKKEYFGKDLLTKYQMIRLRSYMNQSSEKLPQALESLAENVNLDAKLSTRESIHFFKRSMLLIGFCFIGINLLALSESVSQIIVSIFNQM